MTTATTPQQKLAKVNQLASQRQIPQALSLANEITEAYPDFAAAWFTSAFLLFQHNNTKQAISALKMARNLDPTNSNYAFQEIMMFERLNRPDIALSLAQKLATHQLADNRMYEQLARILEVNEDFEGALKLFQRLATNQPNQAAWLLKQATVLQNLGHIDQAEKLSNTALTMEPSNADGQFFRSHLKRQSVTDNHIDSLREACHTKYATATEQAKIHYALAKELEDIHQFDDSFTARKQGAKVFRQSFQYDLQSDIDFMRQIQIEYDADFIQHKSTTNVTDEPIFIVGLPRSGTTLLDRIITSHDQVKAAGELKQFNQCMLNGLQLLKLNPQLSRTKMVTASRQLDFTQLGQSYIQTSRTKTGDSPRFTDKFPQNSYYVGMILKALPNAKVIIMQRNPVAVCYAVYKQLFGNDSYPYSYDLKEMAAYYNQHNQLLNHWQQLGGDSVKTIYYEDLVNDLENQAKGVLKFLNLEWQAQCLDFHKNRQPTATASASQVRQKLYTSSLDLWRQYEQQLQPLINNLDVSIKSTLK